MLKTPIKKDSFDRAHVYGVPGAGIPRIKMGENRVPHLGAAKPRELIRAYAAGDDEQKGQKCIRAQLMTQACKRAPRYRESGRNLVEG